jgi:hypothetical protein
MMVTARKGSLEWNLETIGKLAIYVAVLVFIVWMVWKLIAMFSHGSEEFSAKRNLDLLAKRIEVAQKSGERSFTIALALPQNNAILGFDEDATPLQLNYGISGGLSEVPESQTMPLEPTPFKRPSSCDSACVCVANMATGAVIACRDVAVTTLRAQKQSSMYTSPDNLYIATAQKGDGFGFAFFPQVGKSVTNAAFVLSDNTLTLQ